MDSDSPTDDGTELDSLSNPAELRDRPDVTVTEETSVHEDRDHRTDGVDGRVVVGVENADGELLTLLNRELGVALLPNDSVEAGEDWLEAAREAVEAYTGFQVRIESFEAVREVDHVVEGEDEPHASTLRLVVGATPVGGEIDDCKRAPDAGSDPWVVEWLDELPEGASPPADGVAADFDLFR